MCFLIRWFDVAVVETHCASEVTACLIWTGPAQLSTANWLFQGKARWTSASLSWSFVPICNEALRILMSPSANILYTPISLYRFHINIFYQLPNSLSCFFLSILPLCTSFSSDSLLSSHWLLNSLTTFLFFCCYHKWSTVWDRWVTAGRKTPRHRGKDGEADDKIGKQTDTWRNWSRLVNVWNAWLKMCSWWPAEDCNADMPSVCVGVCMCVWETKRERERECCACWDCLLHCFLSGCYYSFFFIS